MASSKRKRGSKKSPKSYLDWALPDYQTLLDFRWRINQKPDVCVRDRNINDFLFHWKDSGVRFRGCVFPSIREIEGLAYDLAAILTDLLTGYRFVSRFAPTAQPGHDLSGNPIKTRIPGLNGDIRLAYQRLRKQSDWLSPEPYRGEHLKTKIIRLMVKTLTKDPPKKNRWKQEEAFRVIAEAFTRIGEPLTSAAVRKSFFRSRP
jgi:hypothetical protein